MATSSVGRNPLDGKTKARLLFDHAVVLDQASQVFEPAPRFLPKLRIRTVAVACGPTPSDVKAVCHPYAVSVICKVLGGEAQGEHNTVELTSRHFLNQMREGSGDPNEHFATIIYGNHRGAYAISESTFWVCTGGVAPHHWWQDALRNALAGAPYPLDAFLNKRWSEESWRWHCY